MAPKQCSQLVFVAFLAAGCAADEQSGAAAVALIPEIPVREHMETVIAPATNTIWGIEDPQTDDDWQVIDDAAVAVIQAMTAMKEGGSGPNDVGWASNEDWDAYMDAVITAGQMTRKAVEQRDIDAVVEAGNILYPPCEACHLVYHPDVAGQNP